MLSNIKNWPLRKKLWWGYIVGAAFVLGALIPLSEIVRATEDFAYLHYLAPALLTLWFGWVGEKTGFSKQTPNDLAKLIAYFLVAITIPILIWFSYVTADVTFALFGTAYALGDLLVSLLWAHAIFLFPPIGFALVGLGVAGE